MQEIKTSFPKDLAVNLESLYMAPFQGEMCSVLLGKSEIYGDIVIKMGIKNGEITAEGITEITQNLLGFECIPDRFRPHILYVDPKQRFMVMEHAGFPLRDQMIFHRDEITKNKTIIRFFGENLRDLILATAAIDIDATQAYFGRLKEMSEFFIIQSQLPVNEKNLYLNMLNKAISLDDGKGAIATLDSTQGNFLINSTKNPNTLIMIDPKLPRIVNGRSTFLGIPEIDMGMFLTTCELNNVGNDTPEELYENILLNVSVVRSDKKLSKFYFDLGRAFGCILIAAFPNTVARVERYYSQFGIYMNEEMRENVRNERIRHIRKLNTILS